LQYKFTDFFSFHF
jgi:hypothetical protein